MFQYYDYKNKGRKLYDKQILCSNLVLYGQWRRKRSWELTSQPLEFFYFMMWVFLGYVTIGLISWVALVKPK